MFSKTVANTITKTIGRRSFADSASFTPAKLPDLKYDYGELEPAISGKIMQLHHDGHHAAYVKGYNQAVEEFLSAVNKGNHQEAVKQQALIKFNGGGHVNHSIFWTNLAPKGKNGGELPSDNSQLAKLVKQQWGSFDVLKETMNTKTAGIQGSGWCWLAYNPKSKSLVIQDMPNQDPVILTGNVPLLGIDIWEHAYYLQYNNKKAEYLKAVWDVVNWKNVEERLGEANK